jgi:hypothetical protein
MSLEVTEEQSVKDADGRILFFSADHFLRDIVEGDCCFICGASPAATPFNDEHVIPDWILRRYNLHSSRITIPGGSQLRYDQYKVPCCISCNVGMGATIEEPISILFSEGYEALVDELKANGPIRIYTWMNLLFLKTHLKDRSLRLHRDRRIESIQISELYDWPDIHHVHCVTRTFYTGASIENKAMGSVFLWPAKTGTPHGDFDYGDYYPGQAIFARIGEVFVLCVLNDACGVFTLLQEMFQQFTGALSPWQCREMLAHASYANILIENRPTFRTVVDFNEGSLSITADVPDVLKKARFDQSQLGEILSSVLEQVISASDIQNKEEITDQIREGRSTLFDQNGRFIDRPL